MEIEIARQEEALIVAVRGRLDEHRASSLEASCRESLRDEWKAVVDLSGVTEITSGGVRAILRVAVTFRVFDVGVALCPPVTSARSRFDCEAGLGELVMVRLTRRDALARSSGAQVVKLLQ